MLASLVALSACSATSEQPSTRDPRTSSGPPPTALLSAVSALTLDPQFTIGALDGPPEYAFGMVQALAPRPDGGFYVCDQQDQQIRSYDSAGTFLVPIGRSGSGASEYRWCGSMLVLPGDSLLVSDVNNLRLMIFAGTTGRSRAITWPSAHPAIALNSAGHLWSYENRGGRGEGEMAWNTAVLYSRERRALDSIELPSLRRPLGAFTFAVSTEDGNLSPRLEDSLFAVLPTGGAVIAGAAAYEVFMRHTGHDRLLTRSTRALTYSAKERAEWSRFIDRQVRKPQLPLPRTKPIIRELRGDELGRIWIKLADTAYTRTPNRPAGASPDRPVLTQGEQGVWDLFNSNTGEYIGQLRLPPGSELLASRGDRIWLRSSGDEGQTLISVYRMKAAN